MENISEGVDEMAKRVVLFSTKPGDLNSMPETHMVDGEK